MPRVAWRLWSERLAAGSRIYPAVYLDDVDADIELLSARVTTDEDGQSFTAVFTGEPAELLKLDGAYIKFACNDVHSELMYVGSIPEVNDYAGFAEVGGNDRFRFAPQVFESIGAQQLPTTTIRASEINAMTLWSLLVDASSERLSSLRSRIAADFAEVNPSDVAAVVDLLKKWGLVYQARNILLTERGLEVGVDSKTIPHFRQQEEIRTTSPLHQPVEAHQDAVSPISESSLQLALIQMPATFSREDTANTIGGRPGALTRVFVAQVGRGEGTVTSKTVPDPPSLAQPWIYLPNGLDEPFQMIREMDLRRAELLNSAAKAFLTYIVVGDEATDIPLTHFQGLVHLPSGVFGDDRVDGRSWLVRGSEIHYDATDGLRIQYSLTLWQGDWTEISQKRLYERAFPELPEVWKRFTDENEYVDAPELPQAELEEPTFEWSGESPRFTGNVRLAWAEVDRVHAWIVELRPPASAAGYHYRAHFGGGHTEGTYSAQGEHLWPRGEWTLTLTGYRDGQIYVAESEPQTMTVPNPN